MTTTAARAQAELALTASGQGAISSVSVNAMGTDEDGAHRELAARAARLIGDHLLSGQGSALEERLDRSGPVQIAGQEVWTPARADGGARRPCTQRAGRPGTHRDGVGHRRSHDDLSAAAYAAVDDPLVLRKLLSLVRGSGLGGEAMLAWLRAHSRESLALGDVDGIHVVLSAERAEGLTTVYLTFGSICA